MKIGIYVRDIHPHDGGGHTFQEQLLIALNKKLEKDRNYTFIVFHHNDAVQLNYQFLQFVKLEPPFWHKVETRLKRFFTREDHKGWLNYFATANEIDFMWFPTPAFEEIDIPYCFTVWDLQHRLQPFFPEVSKGQEWQKREEFYARVLRKASYVITGTDRGKEETINFYQVASERIRILPLPTPSFQEVAPLPINHLVDEKLNGQYLFYPAQFWSHKNHIRLIEAIHILKVKQNIKFHVVFVGSDKGIKPYLKEAVADKGLDEQVHFLGFVQRGELASLYKNAFALVFPSMFGPDNLPPLEAFSLGCPAIVANVPGSNQQYGSAALFFDALSSEELAERILDIKNNAKIRQELIQKGLNRAQNYTSSHYMEDIFGIMAEFDSIRKTWAGN